MPKHKLQQSIKWIVYTLLIINFVYYVYEDASRAFTILTPASTWLDWTAEFATSIDEAAWFFLLFMFELETYVLEDRTWKPWVEHTVRGVRIVCYLMLAHTIFAFTDTIVGLEPTVKVENISSLCDITEPEIYYVYNLEYTEINAESCGGLSTATEFYEVAEDPVVSSMAGLTLERELAWSDLAEAVIWLIIIAAIELVVRLQSRDITSGPLIVYANRIKYILYAALILIGVWWASLGHWLYFWDELVWIGGFAAIEMNMSEWREEINEGQGEAA